MFCVSNAFKNQNYFFIGIFCMMDAEKKNVANVLRSLIISNPKKGISVGELMADFFKSYGKEIPKFEHPTVDDFLRSTCEFIIKNNSRGEAIIYEKLKSERFCRFLLRKLNRHSSIQFAGFKIEYQPTRLQPI